MVGVSFVIAIKKNRNGLLKVNPDFFCLFI